MLTLLIVTFVSACLNPLFFDEVTVNVNHAPVLIDVQPQPRHIPIDVLAGTNCLPTTFFAARLEDADLDVLTVRYTLLFTRDGQDQRGIIREFELEPLPEPVEGRNYDFPPFDLTRTALAPRVMSGSELDAIGSLGDDRFQLLELRISDNGFIADTNNVEDPTGLLFWTWPIKLRTPDDCGAAP